MKKLILVVSVIFCLSTMLTGCSKMKNKNLSKDEKTDMLDVNVPYYITNYMSMVTRRDDIEKKYGKADIIRKSETKTYEIKNISDGSKLVVIYEDGEGRVIDMWQLKKLMSSESFKNINEGKSSSQDIIKIDPYTTIVETTEDTAISEHKLINNEIIDIDYVKENGSWIVKNLKYVKDALWEQSNGALHEYLNSEHLKCIFDGRWYQFL